nr:MAG TPA: hypothetical protein [Caudoviricetes sp.]
MMLTILSNSIMQRYVKYLIYPNYLTLINIKFIAYL